MLAFYQRLFPFRYLFQWLNHSVKPSNDFGHREFAFTLQNDVYLRYQSFLTSDLFVLAASAVSSRKADHTTVSGKMYFVLTPRASRLDQSTLQIHAIARPCENLRRSGLWRKN